MQITYSNKQLDAYLKARKNLKNIADKVNRNNQIITNLLGQMDSALGTNVTFIGEKIHEEVERLVANRYILNKVKIVHELQKSKYVNHSSSINDFLPVFSKAVRFEPKKCEVIFRENFGDFIAGIKYDVYLATREDECFYFFQSEDGFKQLGRPIRHKNIEFLSDEKFKERMWRTFSGAEIPVKELSHQHMSNIIYYFRYLIGREHTLVISELEERFGGVMLPYNPTLDFRSEIEELVRRGYTTGKPKAPIVINGKTVGHVRYD